MPVISLDLGGTKLAGAVLSDTGEKFFYKKEELNKRKGKEVALLMKDFIEEFLSKCEKKNILINSIGVSVPGIAYKNSGKVWAPNIPEWDDYPLKEELLNFTRHNYKIFIDSDRACYILGERWLGAAKNTKNAIFLAVGTGIGAGILVDDNVVRGANDIAGAIGWMALKPPFEEKYISCGCFEYYASGEGLCKYALELLNTTDNYNGYFIGKTRDTLKTSEIFEYYDKSDYIAVNTISNAIRYWGMAVANLVSLFNPEIIVFGGGVFGPAVKFLDEIYSEAKKWAQPISIQKVKLVPSELGADAGLLGAGYLAFKNIRGAYGI